MPIPAIAARIVSASAAAVRAGAIAGARASVRASLIAARKARIAAVRAARATRKMASLFREYFNRARQRLAGFLRGLRRDVTSVLRRLEQIAERLLKSTKRIIEKVARATSRQLRKFEYHRSLSDVAEAARQHLESELEDVERKMIAEEQEELRAQNRENLEQRRRWDDSVTKQAGEVVKTKIESLYKQLLEGNLTPEEFAAYAQAEYRALYALAAVEGTESISHVSPRVQALIEQMLGVHEQRIAEALQAQADAEELLNLIETIINETERAFKAARMAASTEQEVAARALFEALVARNDDQEIVNITRERILEIAQEVGIDINQEANREFVEKLEKILSTDIPTVITSGDAQAADLAEALQEEDAKDGVVYGLWMLNARGESRENCPDCVALNELTEREPTPIELLPVPGTGATACGQLCHCEVVPVSAREWHEMFSEQPRRAPKDEAALEQWRRIIYSGAFS